MRCLIRDTCSIHLLDSAPQIRCRAFSPRFPPLTTGSSSPTIRLYYSASFSLRPCPSSPPAIPLHLPLLTLSSASPGGPPPSHLSLAPSATPTPRVYMCLVITPVVYATLPSVSTPPTPAPVTASAEAPAISLLRAGTLPRAPPSCAPVVPHGPPLSRRSPCPKMLIKASNPSFSRLYQWHNCITPPSPFDHVSPSYRSTQCTD
ncbi:hypothetical protein B0H17DRAFT_1193407 [Mycena rosella]|uniref:Uncharacterized protein n=1 Tax=Mycena rosella TaxID=1033263 RepID=A0AAD7M7X9_MYCRO|nr:hypothetical protein B0H17DRAFT_1193407 [Mycena rosella]